MAWTKRQLIEAAFEELGLAPYAFDLSPEQMQFALRRLDGMMAQWNDKGARLGYPLSDLSSTSLDDDSNVPDVANEAIYLNLALRLAPTFGKTVMRETKIAAKSAYLQVLTHASTVPQMAFPKTMPRGAGNKSYQGESTRFFDGDPVTIDAGKDGELEFLP